VERKMTVPEKNLQLRVLEVRFLWEKGIPTEFTPKKKKTSGGKFV